MKKIIIIVFLVTLSAFSQYYGYRIKQELTQKEVYYGMPLYLDGEEIEDNDFPYLYDRKVYRHTVENGAKTSFRVRVVDEDAHPVEGATVASFMCMESLEPKYGYGVSAKTDKNGIAHIEGICDGNVSFSARKKGWYPSVSTKLHYYFMKKVSLEDGKWQPYDTEYKIVLRKRKNPITSQYEWYSYFVHEFPANDGKPVGVDIFLRDWVAPWGKGKVADFFLQLTERSYNESKVTTLTFTFPNKKDGMYVMPFNKMSAFKTQYTALKDDSAYRPKFEINEIYALLPTYHRRYNKEYRFDKIESNSIGTDNYIVLRTRTELDKNGNIVSCYYSKIDKNISINKKKIIIHWIQNPTPNDNRLEEYINRGVYYDEKKEEKKEKDEISKISEDDIITGNKEKMAAEKVLSAFLEASFSREPEKSLEFYLLETEQQKKFVNGMMGMIRSFTSKNKDVKTATEPVAYMKDNAAIIPVRQWRTSKPEKFEIEEACMVKRNEKWYVLPDFSNYSEQVNNLSEEDEKKFYELHQMFKKYKQKKREEIKKNK